MTAPSQHSHDGGDERAPRRVQVLPATLANQIAAGEVVERPASVLKELLENAIDAGARRIDIELERGGMDLIRVRDDGIGIEHDDLALALHRHATSKIRTLGELEAVASLGFRGEALPSIASVARLELGSRTVSGEQGFQVVADGAAQVAAPRPAALPAGTQVVVRDLFFNTPARRKFLRTEKTEFRHADEVARRVALSRFDIAISLSHNTRKVWSVQAATTPAARLKRVARLCGQVFCKHAYAIDFDGPELRLNGWVASPDLQRASAGLQHFFLNGRMIRDRVVSHAIRQAYGDALPDGSHPAYVLYLAMNPAHVDINVHPAKHEVRFRDSRSVHDFLLRALDRALREQREPQALPDARLSATAPMPGHPHSGTKSFATVQDQIAGYARLHRSATAAVDDVTAERAVPESDSGLGRALGHVGGRHLLAIHDDALVVIDWRGARRLVLERRLTQALQSDGTVGTKPLLVPVNAALSETGLERLERKRDWLSIVGVDIMPAGPAAASLRAVPSLLERFEPAVLLQELLDELESITEASGVASLLVCLADHDARCYRLDDDLSGLQAALASLSKVVQPHEQLDFIKHLDVDALNTLLHG